MSQAVVRTSHQSEIIVFVRSMLYGVDYRFTVNGPKTKNLPERPDIVLPKWETVAILPDERVEHRRSCLDKILLVACDDS